MPQTERGPEILRGLRASFQPDVVKRACPFYFIDHFLPGNLATIAYFIANAGKWLFWLSFSAFGVVLLSPRSLLQERPADMAVARDASPADR